MKKYLVTRTIKLSRIIEANSKNEAIELMYDSNADIKLIKETAKLIKNEVKS